MTKENPNYYVAIDPGNRTGWATADCEGRVTGNSAIKGTEAFLDWFEELQPSPEVVIVESYEIRQQHFNHQGSRVPTIQHIGAIKSIAKRTHGVGVKEQRSINLPFGLRYLGLYGSYYNPTTQRKKDKHIPDEVSALAHLTYYLRKNKVTHG